MRIFECYVFLWPHTLKSIILEVPKYDLYAPSPAAFFCDPFFSSFWHRAFEAIAGRKLAAVLVYNHCEG